MKPEYVDFFNNFPITAQLSIKMLIPDTYKTLSTDLLTAIFIQNGMVKKCIIDSLKATSHKSIEKFLRASGDEKRVITEFSDIEVSEECECFLNNVLYFIHNYGDSKSVDNVCYISWRLISDNRLKSYNYLRSLLYKGSDETIVSLLSDELKTFTGISDTTSLLEFGKYLIHPLLYTSYKCFGREEEIEKSINILCRKKKRNLMLVGNPGVGKTCIVYGICNYLQSSRCPKNLRGVSVFELNVTSLISGTTYRGDLETRIKELINAVSNTKNIIIFVDEIHTLFSSGFSSEGGTQSIQQQLKPFLQDNSFMIGCTTNSDYKVIEKDKAFERRFSVVEVKEMSKLDTLNLLHSVKSQYEKWHSVSISDDSCDYIVSNSSKFLKSRYFPDKALDVMDVSSVLAYRRGSSSVEISDIDKAVLDLSNLSVVSDDIDKISERIKCVLFGQDHAVDAVMHTIKRYRIGVHIRQKPIGSFLFVGKTGTGKTELCRQLAENLFSTESFIRCDMSEYMESHSISKLIGSPPGYVGHYSGGSLTEKVKHYPFSLILFDEIEKAHKDVLNILLQIMDDGRLTDSFGNVVDFCNCLIIMTSNIGCSNNTSRSVGFCSGDVDKNAITDSVKKYFSPEFLGRLDDVIYFNDIDETVVAKIVEREINNFVSLYNDIGICVKLDESAKTEIVSQCKNLSGGVRAIQRKITNLIEPLIIDNAVGIYEVFYDNKFFVK